MNSGIWLSASFGTFGIHKLKDKLIIKRSLGNLWEKLNNYQRKKARLNGGVDFQFVLFSFNN